MIDKIRRTYGAFTASYDYRTVSKFVRNTSRAFTLEYCAKTAVYGAVLEQNARFRPIYDSLRRSVMIDLGSNVMYSLADAMDKTILDILLLFIYKMNLG